MVIRSAMFEAFTDEMVKIKVAEEDSRFTAPEVGTALKNMALGALAYSAGSQAARIGSEKLFPKIMSVSASPNRVNMMGKGLGILTAAGTLALADAIAENARMVRGSRKRD